MAERLLPHLRREWALPLGLATTLAFLLFGKDWFANLAGPAWYGFLLAWLFAAIMVSAFAVVRHADALAERLGEPYGTLVLTVTMSGMEMMMIAAVMSTRADAAAAAGEVWRHA